MKYFAKKTISTLILIGILLTFVGAAEIANQSSNEPKIDTEIGICEQLDAYFDVRQTNLNLFSRNTTASEQYRSISLNIERAKVSDAVRAIEFERATTVENLIIYHGVYPTRAQNSYYVMSSRQSAQTPNHHILNVYEWTWIEYTNGEDNIPNQMGYATEHLLVLEKQPDGTFMILTDEYDESNIFGEYESRFQDRQAMEEMQERCSEKNETSSMRSLPQMADTNALIDYADQYVIHEKASGMHTAYYNTPMYGYYTGADCVNFVSQCMRVGGMAMNYGTGKNYANADATQWWYDTFPNPLVDNLTVCPPAWRSVPNFVLYWTQLGYSNVSATASTVYPGNPVLHGTAHAGICVGYNSAGTPIINAHNSDVYHVPYTMIGTGTRTTIQINTSNHMVWKPSDATTLTPTSSDQSILKTLTQRINHYIKIVVSSTYDFIFESAYHSPYSIDTKATLYRESVGTGDNTVFLYEIAADDNSGTGNNFLIDKRLSPGTYYLRVRATTPFAYGQYKLHYRTEN